MIDDPIQALEFKNAFLFFLTFGMSAVFASILYIERKQFDAFYGAVIGFFVFASGLAAHQAWYWAWRHYGHQDSDWITYTKLSILFLIGTWIAVGAACIIRNLTINRFGHSVWVAAVAFAVIGAGATLVLPH